MVEISSFFQRPSNQRLTRMSQRAVAVRMFLMTCAGGGLVLGATWLIVSIGSASARTAATTVPLLVFGSLVTVLIGVAVAIANHRRSEDISRLGEKLEWISQAEPMEFLVLPSAHSAPMQGIYRRLKEAHDSGRKKYLRLEAEKRLGFHVLGHMTEGVLAVTGDRRVLLMNHAARRLLGLTRDKPSGYHLADVCRVPQILSIVDAILAGKGPQQVDFRLTTTDQERFLQVLAIALPAENSSGVLVTIRDESQVRQLESMRREFIANVSHELKTPLSAVKGYAETLQLGAKDEPETCEHFLQQIIFQATRLERLISDMLQLARAQSGTTHLSLGRVALQSVLHESLAAYEPVAAARGQTLTWETIPPGASVIADREALLTIVNNLLGNAIRYTPEGGHIRLAVRPGQEPDSQTTPPATENTALWGIIVEDDGIGIPSEDQERIFERFYRVEKARDATRGGTGLGLAIVKNLVQALGGQIRLTSEPAKGSSFEVWLHAAGQ